MSDPERTVFILSPRHRDALRDMVEAAGWQGIAARRDDAVADRFVASGARVAIVDLREARSEDLSALVKLGPAAERTGAALVALVDDPVAARDALSAGATHFWHADVTPDALDLLLQTGRLHSDRVRQAIPILAHAASEAPASWRWEKGTRSVELSPALARKAGFGTEGGRRVSLMELFRKLDGDGRRAARRAVDRLQESGAATGFAHGLVQGGGAGQDRMAHHVGIEDNGAIVGRVETLAAPAAQTLEAELPDALTRGEIDILFQPQVKMADGRMIGVEALARWRHPRLGEIDAPTLFAVAERSGRMLDLSRHVQRAALNEAASWPAALGRLRIAINVTSIDIAQPDFADRFIAQVAATGIDRDRVTVEITESGLIADLATASTLLADLRAHGLRVAIDDFGTGYSSLAYLKALPLDYLKIDKQMAQDIEGTPRDRVVVRGVIDMARALGLAVIAEGVETERQLTLLAAEGCNYYQGYLYAPALTSAALVAMVTRKPAVAA